MVEEQRSVAKKVQLSLELKAAKLSSLHAKNFQLRSELAKMKAERVEEQRSFAEKIQLSSERARIQEQRSAAENVQLNSELAKLQEQRSTAKVKDQKSIAKESQLSAEMAKLQEQRSAAQLQEQRCRQEAWIERTPFPSFDSDQENWQDFRRVFQELMADSRQGGVVKPVQLKSKLTTEAVKLMAGSQPQKKHGGFWKIGMVIEKLHKLESLRLPKGPAHGKVEALVTPVITTRTYLRAVGAKQQLFATCFRIAKLVRKPNENTQTR